MAAAPELQRAYLPLEIYPISAGDQGRAGWQRGHGAGGDALWSYERATAFGIRSIFWPPGFLPVYHDGHNGQDRRIQSQRLSDRHTHSPDHIVAGRVALRRHAPHASAAADSAGRLHRADPLDRVDSQHSRNRESSAQPANPLDLVRGFASRFWDCRGHCCLTAGTHTHMAARAARLPLGHGGFWNAGRNAQRGRNADEIRRPLFSELCWP